MVGMGERDIHGVDEYYPWWKEALDKYANTQHMLSPFAKIEGDNAYTRTDVQALHFPGDSETIILWGTYKTDMTRVNGEWKISVMIGCSWYQKIEV